MAFMNKIGNVLRQNVSKHFNSTFSASNPSFFQAIRCMSSSKIFVGGLSYGTDDTSLKEAFTTYGEVIETKVIVDRESGRSRGFGFVSFTSSEEASSAVQAMDGQDLHGRRITVNYATERAGGFRSAGGYGGGGYDGGYGGSGGGDGGAYGGTGGRETSYDNSNNSGGGCGGYGGSGGGDGGAYGGTGGRETSYDNSNNSGGGCGGYDGGNNSGGGGGAF